ncbi:hypothetical protein SBADM41S_10163 [Streptomyces badius]
MRLVLLLVLWIAVAGGRALLRALLGPLRLLLRPGDLPLGAAAQRVLVRVQVLDLRLLVAVPRGPQLVLPGVLALLPVLALPVRLVRGHRRHDGRRVGGAGVRQDGGGVGGAGRAPGVREHAGCAVRVVRARRGALRKHLGRVGGTRRAGDRGGRRVGGEQRADALGGCDLRGVRVHADAVGHDAQAAGQVLGARPLVGVLAQAALDDRPQRLGDGGGAARFGAQVLVQHLQAETGERGAAGDQLVQQDAGAVDVDRRGLRAALRGFRGHVRGRADELVGAGEAGRVGEPGDAEVGQHQGASGRRPA